MISEKIWNLFKEYEESLCEPERYSILNLELYTDFSGRLIEYDEELFIFSGLDELEAKLLKKLGR